MGQNYVTKNSEDTFSLTRIAMQLCEPSFPVPYIDFFSLLEKCNNPLLIVVPSSNYRKTLIINTPHYANFYT